MMWPATRVRRVFVEYFQSLQHSLVASSRIVLEDDPSLLFVSAGVCQFKPICLGTCDPASSFGRLNRACNSQKCIRAGGKHNDLDDVGKDTYHQTFFEMLGNWSFNGDYFKREAIQWAWKLLTEVYGVPTEQLYVTYFGGDDKLGLPADNESREIWLELLPSDRVLPFGCKDNFWEMGETGPCGPCSEIHYDRIGNRDASTLVNADDPTCIEIWNLVFMEFSRENDGCLKPLPSKHVDTGMGLERLTSVLQNKMSNYDTDLFQPIIQQIQDITGARPYEGRIGKEDVDKVDTAYRVVADHIRTLCIAIADGYPPGRDGREYVMRRILRRAVRYCRDILKAKQGLLCSLVPTVVQVLGDVYPELHKAEGKIREIVDQEEASFGRTLTKGLQRFNKMVSGLQCLTGEVAFLLYDSYGFPIDLTQQMAQERGIEVDVQGFDRVMEESRLKALKASRNKRSGLFPALQGDDILQLQKRGIALTEDEKKYARHRDSHSAQVKAIFTHSGFVEEFDSREERCGLVLDTTSFYSEQGGQVFDTGFINSEECSFKVENVQLYGAYVLHLGSATVGRIRVGDNVVPEVDYERRARVSRNHTCTHLLNYALRSVLGQHVDQKGSLVAPDKFKLDFSHGKPVDAKELEVIQSAVIEKVRDELEVYTKEVRLAEAERIAGIRAVFSGNYPDAVRVVAIGKSVEELMADPENPSWMNMSTELCGGTHLTNTREVEDFALVSEEGISLGVRRVVAVTGEVARVCISKADDFDALVDDEEAKQEEASNVGPLRASVEAAELPVLRKARIMSRLGQLQERQSKLHKAAAQNAHKMILDAAVGNRCSVQRLDLSINAKALGEIVQSVLKQMEVAIMVFCVDSERNKVLVCAGCNLAGVLAANVSSWLKDALQPVKGQGGGVGKSGLAQGQGSFIQGVDEAICLARTSFHFRLNA